MADISQQNIAKDYRLDENFIKFNSAPQSGLGDNVTRTETMIFTN